MGLDSVKRILAASDLATGSEQVIDAVIALSRTFGASAEIVHVEDPVDALLDLKAIPRSYARRFRVDTQRRSDIDGELVAQCERVRAAGITCVTTALQGRATGQIVSHVAKTAPDLLVVGLSARAGRHLLFGHLGFRLSRRVSCPILLLPLGVPPEATGSGGAPADRKE